jgi:hypothetical protein
LRVLDEKRRFNVLCCGRRWGKTTLGVDRLIVTALRGQPVAWFSPSYRMLTEAWRSVRRLVAPAVDRIDMQQHRIELLGGGVIEMWSLDSPDSARGRKYNCIVVDEAAMIRHLEDAWMAVLRPTLLDFKGSAWFMSTPKGLNYFKRLWDLGQDGGPDDWMSWQMPTTTNPFIDPTEIEASRELLPERTYAQEFLAQFLEDGGGVFRRVNDAATAVPQEQAVEGHRYVVGADWGKSEDFTVFTVVDCTTGECVALDRSNKVDYALQVGRLRALYDRFTPDAIYAEQNSMGVPIVEQLQRLNLPVRPFLTTNASKAQAIDGLALAFERGTIKIPDDPTLIGELQAYDAERLPSGLLRYGAPPGQHDDCVMSLALAWWGASAPTVQFF